MKKTLIAAIPGLICLAGLTGCYVGKAVEMKPTTITYGKMSDLIEYEEPRYDLLRVAQFEDKRPVEETVVDSPRGMFLLLGYRQKGTFRTGNEAWNVEEEAPDGLGPDMTRSIADAMRASGFFKEVKVEDETDPVGGSGLILKGTIENMEASQYLNRYGYFLFVFWGSTYDRRTPGGKCRIRYTLVDGETDQILKEGTVEKAIQGGSADSDASSKSKIIETGIKTARGAHTKLSNDLTQILIEL